MIIRFWWVYCIINFWIGKMAKLMDDISLFSWKAYHVWLETCSRCIDGSCKSYCYVIFTSSFVSYFWREISEPYFWKFPALFVYISNWPARQRKSKFSITKETILKFCTEMLSTNFWPSFFFQFSGDKSTNPNEACMNYYFDAENSPIITLVSEGGHNTRPCPFSGRYTLTGAPHTGAMSALMSGQLNCHQAIMHAGCSASDDLIVESVCSRNLEDNVR